MATDTLIDDLVVRGISDWIQAAEVAWVAKSLGGAKAQDDIAAVALDLIRTVLLGGLMEAGEVTDGGFIGWDVPVQVAASRIEHEWARLGRLPNLGEVCWLANTAAGNKRAEAVVGRTG